MNRKSVEWEIGFYWESLSPSFPINLTSSPSPIVPCQKILSYPVKTHLCHQALFSEEKMFARDFFYCFNKETGFRDGHCIQKSPAIIFPTKVKKKKLSMHCMATAGVKSFMSGEKGGVTPWQMEQVHSCILRSTGSTYQESKNVFDETNWKALYD